MLKLQINSDPGGKAERAALNLAVTQTGRTVLNRRGLAGCGAQLGCECFRHREPGPQSRCGAGCAPHRLIQGGNCDQGSSAWLRWPQQWTSPSTSGSTGRPPPGLLCLRKPARATAARCAGPLPQGGERKPSRDRPVHFVLIARHRGSLGRVEGMRWRSSGPAAKVVSTRAARCRHFGG